MSVHNYPGILSRINQLSMLQADEHSHAVIKCSLQSASIFSCSVRFNVLSSSSFFPSLSHLIALFTFCTNNETLCVLVYLQFAPLVDLNLFSVFQSFLLHSLLSRMDSMKCFEPGALNATVSIHNQTYA